MMALRPDLVNLEKAEGPSAIDGLYDRVKAHSSVAYGQKAVDRMADRVNAVNETCLAALRNPDPSLFEVPTLTSCRGAKNIAKLREENPPPA